MNVEEIEKLAPEAGLAKAIELNPNAKYVFVFEEPIPDYKLELISQLIKDKGFNNVLLAAVPNGLRIYKLEA